MRILIYIITMPVNLNTYRGIVGTFNSRYLIRFRNSYQHVKCNQFLVCTIFFTIMNIFFQSALDLFLIIAKEVNQIRNNVVCAVARLVSLFCCALTTGRRNAFQHNFVN